MTDTRRAIALTTANFQALDLTPAQTIIEAVLAKPEVLSDRDLTFTFDIDFPREASDPRELSEIPEIRLWFLRLNAQYPWLPLYLDWESGELSRYTAMLVPHQFSPIDGIRYNPEALEIFVMSKVFTLDDWLREKGIDGRSSDGGVSRTRLKFMTQMLGYELDDALFNLL
ncbi:MAG: DUF1817 domain-containing protein [Leptolyngbya foveolarum]|uniref:DUF1817 domain-containing protein n=1 Tax=Leptolyngbya foveolarum TaxID=47253 RepID=A0A2W4W2F3_9CYAN|nr:MAG: DUF1817 domain-containing protein [Leptolyngbya foveolarum]